MPFCHVCGIPLDDGDQFCPACGHATKKPRVRPDSLDSAGARVRERWCDSLPGDPLPPLPATTVDPTADTARAANGAETAPATAETARPPAAGTSAAPERFGKRHEHPRRSRVRKVSFEDSSDDEALDDDVTISRTTMSHNGDRTNTFKRVR